jgi:hypothetical protein
VSPKPAEPAVAKKAPEAAPAAEPPLIPPATAANPA